MRKVLLLMSTCIALFSAHAHANLCDSVTDVVRPVMPGIEDDLNLYEELFPDVTDSKVIVDGMGSSFNATASVTPRAMRSEGDRKPRRQSGEAASESRNLDPKVIRGHYDFVGLPIGSLLSFKYIYILSKKDGVWTMIIPYRPSFNELVPNRVDFNFTHAKTLFDASQVENPSRTAQVLNLKSDAQPIATTLCSTSTYFPGDKGKYDEQRSSTSGTQRTNSSVWARSSTSTKRMAKLVRLSRRQEQRSLLAVGFNTQPGGQGKAAGLDSRQLRANC